jgi:hypothetical protein
MNSLDNILSGQGDAVSEQLNNEEVTQAEQVGEAQQEQPKTEPDEDQAVDVGGQKMVPHAALHASKEKVKRYTEEVADFRKSNESLQRQVNELLQRIPVPKKETPQEQPRPDWFENPEGATQYTVQQSVDPHFQRINQTLLANAQLVAGMKYGDDKVAEADQAFMQAVQSGKIDPADYQKVTTAPNIFAAAVQWHQREQAKAEIGDDITAYRAKLEAELREKITAELQQSNGQQASMPAAVMPSNIAGARNVGSRTGPAWSGPPSLQDIFSR